MLSTTFPPDIGGLENHIFNLSLALARLGHRIAVVNLRYGQQHHRVDKYDKFEVHRVYERFNLRKFRYILSVIKEKMYLEKLTKTKRIDLVHLHDLSQNVWVTKFMRNRFPMIFTNHTSQFIERTNKSISKLLLMIQYGHFDAVIAPSKELRRLSLFLRPKLGVYYIPNGVDPNIFSPNLTANRIRQLYKLDSTHKVVICPRRFEPKNGVVYFVQAMPYIKKLVPNVKFLLIGGGYPEERKKFENFIRHHNLQKDVIFTGMVENNKMPEYYACSDVVVIPSLMEATSLAGLEAMASGKPVVGTTVGGLPEIITNKTGILVPCKDSVELGKAVTYLLKNHELRKKMGIDSRQRAIDLFSWDSIAKQTQQVYYAALENHISKSLLNSKR
ncbi:MAG: glycosyltransferase family 4 protein [Candidatus Hodarchaeota archaeon]